MYNKGIHGIFENNLYMNPYEFKEFVTDVRNLYLLTKIPSIENCFLKLAAFEKKIDAIDFIRWIEQEKKSKQKNKLENIISTKELPYIFSYLYRCQSRLDFFTKNPSELKKELFKHDPRIIEIIATLNSLLTDYSVNGILLPFKDSIGLICKAVPFKPFQPEIIKRDLEIIYKDYNSFLHQQVEELQDLFVKLLNRFSADIGNALTKIGRKDLAQKIMSGKILFRPDL